VDRAVVHRASADTVLVGAANADGPGSWHLPVAVPPLAAARPGGPLPLLHGVEVFRQAGLVVAHQGHQVPTDFRFTIQDIAFGWADGARPRLPDDGRFTAEARVRVIEHHERRGVTSALRVEVDVTDDAGPVAAGGGLLRCVSPANYRALRRRAHAPASSPHRSDPDSLRDVERAHGELSAHIGWDDADPLLFDHATDHLSGLVMMAAAVRAAEVLADGREVRRVAMAYDRFVEYEPEPVLRAALAHDTVAIRIEQAGTVAASGSCRVA
jgi:hypothetical protein